MQMTQLYQELKNLMEVSIKLHIKYLNHMLNIIRILHQYLSNQDLKSRNKLALIFYISMLFTSISCVKSKKELDATVAVKMIVDSIQNKAGYPTSGYIKYIQYPDTYAEYSMSNFDYLYKKHLDNADSIRIIIYKLMRDTTRYNFKENINNGKAQLIFDESLVDFSVSQQKGVFHISELGYYDNNRKALLYFSFLCGQKCGKGYLIQYTMNEKKDTWEVYQVLPLWDSNP